MTLPWQKLAPDFVGLNSGYRSRSFHAPAFVKSTRIHRLHREAEVLAGIRPALRRSGRRLSSASPARIARENADLLEPVFQRKFMLAPLGVAADSSNLASRMFARSRRRRSRALGGTRSDYGWRLSGRCLSRRCLSGH